MIYNLNEKFTKVNERKGVLENKSGCSTIELAVSDDVPEKDIGIELQPKEKMVFNLEAGKNLYARCTNLTGVMANLGVVNFNLPASSSYDGVGGLYVLEWKADTKYVVGQLVTHNNLLYKCISDHTSGTNFVSDTWQQLTIGYIADWQANHYYNQNEVIIADNMIVRCNAIHTSGATYDITESACWDEISSKDSGITIWKQHTQYDIDEVVVYNDSFFISNTAHTSGNSFTDDMTAGVEKWRAIGAGGSGGGSTMKQVTKLGVVGTTLVEVAINNTLTFNLPPVEILKFTAGTKDKLITEFDFSSGDGSKFTIDGASAETNDFIKFDGTVHTNNKYSYQMVKKDDFTGAGQYSEDTNIDDTVFKSIESADVSASGGIDECTKVMMHMNDSAFTDIDAASITNNNSVVYDESIKKFGIGSAKFNNTNLQHLKIISGSQIFSPSGDLTVDFWFYCLGAASNPQVICSIPVNDAGTNRFASLEFQPTNRFRIVMYGVGEIMGQVTATFPYNQWNHIAITVSGVVYKLYINGVLVGTATNPRSVTVASSTTFYIGEYPSNGWGAANGYIDEFRVSSGVLRWTKNFTPPAAEYRSSGKFLAKTNLREYYSNKSGGWVKLYAPSDDVALIDLFKNEGTETPSTQAELESLGIGINRPRRCCYQEINDDEIPTVTLVAVPKDKLILPKSLIQIDGFEGIDKTALIQTVSGSNQIKFIITVDLITYKTFNFTSGAWETIDQNDLAEVKSAGIDSTSLSTITRAQWDTLTLGNTGIGFAFLLSQEASADSCSIDSLSMKVDLRGSWDKAVHGTDYKYGYPQNNLLHVTLLTDGDYKINYNE